MLLRKLKELIRDKKDLINATIYERRFPRIFLLAVQNNPIYQAICGTYGGLTVNRGIIRLLKKED